MKKDNNQANKNSVIPDGRDIEFSEELADQEDKMAQERSREADARAKNQ
ncbi:YfhD family protein [Bacillus sp. RG28]|uniref:YfhD family protein n=1 Tax=Gottfriedia endophytica TaxID=2820819 RepID=A0A940NIC2_9BACI|nr:YfhD family protein [Gottfriedia endophytica]MBP0725919.1 YfhD family protein [Gottfriedia endophytica]